MGVLQYFTITVPVITVNKPQTSQNWDENIKNSLKLVDKGFGTGQIKCSES